MNKSRRGKCIYCGKADAVTDDHVPPQNLFQSGAKLIRVPACKDCNNLASKDDEFFRLMLVTQNDAYNHPDAKKLWNTSVLRSLKMPKKKGFTRSIINRLKMVPVYSEAGIYLGNHPGMQGGEERLLRVVERIIKGLYYKEHKKRLPDNYSIRAIVIDRFRAENYVKAEGLREVIKLLINRKKITIGDDVFSYRFIRAKEDEYLSAWLLTFFRGVMFYALSVPEKKVSHID